MSFASGVGVFELILTEGLQTLGKSSSICVLPLVPQFLKV
jgi:hypothetical protein